MTSYPNCLDAPWKHGREEEFFWESGIILVVVGFLGLAGILLTILVLCKSELRKRLFYKLLLALVCFDLLFIVSYGVCLGYRELACHQHYSLYIYYVTYPLLNIGLPGSICMTVAISAERYIALCFPHLALKKKSRLYIGVVVVFTVAFNIPRFAEKSFVMVNGTLTQQKHPWVESQAYHMIYYLWADILCLSILPLVLLFYFNGAIIRHIYRSSRDVDCLGSCHVKDSRTTKILLSIVCVFMICHTPRIAYRILYYLDEADIDRWFSLVPIYKLALMVNSSVNFLIYCLIGDKFRQDCIRLFRPRSPYTVNN
jgi:neuropeptide Y receptor type 1